MKEFAGHTLTFTVVQAPLRQQSLTYRGVRRQKPNTTPEISGFMIHGESREQMDMFPAFIRRSEALENAYRPKEI